MKQVLKKDVSGNNENITLIEDEGIMHQHSSANILSSNDDASSNDTESSRPSKRRNSSRSTSPVNNDNIDGATRASST